MVRHDAVVPSVLGVLVRSLAALRARSAEHSAGDDRPAGLHAWMDASHSETPLMLR